MPVEERKRPGSAKRDERIIIAALLLGYCVVGLAANICFKQGGADPGHRLLYFVMGNSLGISSTAILMAVYARMQVNLALVLASTGTFVAVQLTFWLLYHTAMSSLELIGIAMVGIGTSLFAWGAPKAVHPNAKLLEVEADAAC